MAILAIFDRLNGWHKEAVHLNAFDQQFFILF